MITYPSYDELMNKADSPYTLVILTARRARQINDGADELLGEYKSRKPVSKSLEEIAKGKISFCRDEKKAIK